MKNSLLTTILVVIIGSCSSPTKNDFTRQNDLQSTIVEFEQQLITDLDNDASISGVIIANNKIVWSNAVGFSDYVRGITADTATVYRIGSISKSFTAFLMMQMVQDGTIRLNDPIEEYFPEISNLKGYTNTTKITFKQLASHTSGLIREPKLKGAASGPISEWEAKILESISHTSFGSQPGNQMKYSNIGYGILGMALSRAAGRPFIDLVETKIFKPLKMRNSYFVVTEDKLSKLSKGSIQGFLGTVNRKRPEIEHKGRGYKVPNGGIYSTPNDMAKFMFCLMGLTRDLLHEENLELMQNTVELEGKKQLYGLGLTIRRDSLLTTFGHGGSVSGYRAKFAIDKDRGNGVVLMGNYTEEGPDIRALPNKLLKAMARVDLPD